MAPKSTTATHPHTPPFSRPKVTNTADLTRRTELLQILNILILVYHRNKNQHRRSRWWKELSLLRRNLRRLLDEGEKSNWEKRISFLRARILPRCWVAFSGLVGDNQYAALGLMLLGTLGRLGRVVGWVREGEVGEEVVVVKEEVGGIGQEEEVEQENGGGMEVEEDLGVPLLREEVMQTKEAQIKENEKKPVRVESEAVSAKTEKAAAKKKRKKKHHDAIDELFSSLI